MDVSRWVVDQERPDHYVLDPDLVKQRGTFRAWRTTALLVLVLLVVQWPVRQVALTPAEGSTSGSVVWDGAATVPGRLSVLLDLALVLAYTMSAWRARRYVLAVREPHGGWARVTSAVVAGVFLGGALDVWEDVALYVLLADRDRGPGALDVSWGQAVGLDGAGDGMTALMRIVVGSSGLALVALVLLALRTSTLRAHAPAPDGRSVGPDCGGEPDPEPNGTIICCSGGGIRAAAFTMGGLQALRAAGEYDRAHHVVAVSGGGYTAAAFHVARWSPGDPGAEEVDWTRAEPERAFDLASPETGWVRRHTRYLLGSFSTAVQGTLSLAYGIAVNTLLVGTVLVLTAWTLGVLLPASGRLVLEEDGVVITGGAFGDRWWVLRYAAAPVAAGVALFVLRRVVEKWFTLPRGSRVGIEWCTAWLVKIGAVAALLVLGVPWLVGELCSPTPFGLRGEWRTPLNAVVGLDYQAATPESGGSVPRATSVGLGAILVSVITVLRGARSVGKGEGTAWWAKGWRAVRDVVVPWVAVAVVALVVVVLLLRLTASVVRDPAGVAAHATVGWFLGLLVFAKLTTDANRTSLHHFYRWRISLAFLVRRRGGGVEPIPSRRPLRFSESAPLDGGPSLVSCAVANVTDEDLVPSDRGCVPFVFDHQHIGLTDRLLPAAGGRQPSEAYELAADSRFREVTVPAALAISGAAFSPLAGRENKLLGPFRVVLALANARLGVWLPNPLYLDAAAESAKVPLHWSTAGPDVDAVAEARHGLARAEARATRAARAVARARTRWTSDRVRGQAEAEFAAATAQLAERREALDRARDAHATAIVERRQAWSSTRRRGVVRRTFRHAHSTFCKPGLTRVAKEAFGKASIYDQFLYVTDGGHYDNLGLVEALRRRPEQVIVLDASNDKEDEFSALGVAIATARMDLDCEIEIDPRQMRRPDQGRSPAGWCRGTYRYADGTGGTLLVAKAIMLDDLSWDLEAYVAAHPDFPRTSTVDQLYGELDFEAYRALGQHATEKLLAMPGPGAS